MLDTKGNCNASEVDCKTMKLMREYDKVNKYIKSEFALKKWIQDIVKCYILSESKWITNDRLSSTIKPLLSSIINAKRKSISIV